MQNLLTKETIEAVAVKEESNMGTQITEGIKEENSMEVSKELGVEAFSSEVVLPDYGQRNDLKEILSYGNYDFDNPKLFMLGWEDDKTISDVLLRRGAKLVERVDSRKCHTDYFSYEDGDVMVAVSYNSKGIGRPVLIDTDDYYVFFKGRNIVLNHQGDFTKVLNNPMPVPKTYKSNKVARLVLEIQDAGKDVQADHINSNRFDNRKANLRAVTNKQNSKNRSSSKNGFGDYAYKDENDYRFGTAVLIERYFFREMSAELASVYNQILLEYFSSFSFSIAS